MEYLYLYDENNNIITFIKNNYNTLTRRELVETVWAMTQKYRRYSGYEAY